MELISAMLSILSNVTCPKHGFANLTGWERIARECYRRHARRRKLLESLLSCSVGDSRRARIAHLPRVWKVHSLSYDIVVA